jgi:hypothetical protein
MRFPAAISAPFKPRLRNVRTPVLALAAALIFLVGTFLAIAALTPTDQEGVAPASALGGGETTVAKYARADQPGWAGLNEAKPTSPNRLLAMALTPMISSEPARNKEPTLQGLSEIPRDLIWNRPPEEQEKERPKAFGVLSKASEALPWDAVEPVPFSPLADAPVKTAAAKPTAAPREPLALPDSGKVEAWVKTKITEIKGADRTRPLYHFQLWLEPPADVKRRLVGVTYDFSTPAVRPQMQASSDQSTGFRINAGGLACADKITVTLRFDDGRSQKVAIDGCKLLS